MATIRTALAAVLAGLISEPTQEAMFRQLGDLAVRPVGKLTAGEEASVLATVGKWVRLFGDRDAASAVDQARTALKRPPEAAPRESRWTIERAEDIAVARKGVLAAASEIGFWERDAIRAATASSELARNIILYATRGTLSASTSSAAGAISLEILAADEGPGIPTDTMSALEAGTYRSQHGLGKGIQAVRRLADTFDLRTGRGQGTTVLCAFRSVR